MKSKISIAFMLLALTFAQAQNVKQPNILFCIADDASMISFGAYGGTTIKTPAFDRLAKEGAIFKNAYDCNPKCSPSRACLVTGKYSWQLEEAGNHFSVFPSKFKTYPALLKDNGFHTGYTGKGWGPGVVEGGGDNPAGKEFNTKTLEPPYTGINKTDYAANFEAFLDQKPSEKPFCFWLGTFEPHRAYEKDSWKKAGMKLSNAVVPPYSADNDIIRGDLLDYALEIQWVDTHIGKAIKALEDRGLLENTLVIVTSDHGMPFPRIKGQMYEDGFHVPMIAYWKGVIQPGRVIEDFVNFPDVAPTIMEAVGLKPDAQMTGKSFLNLLRSPKSGQIDKTRDHVLLGKERHDIGTVSDEGVDLSYPVRVIRTKKFIYSHNIKPNLCPVGNPELGWRNTDGSPTKNYITALKSTDAEYHYYELNFGKRPEEELFQVDIDPNCMKNLAADPAYKKIKASLRAQMEKELTAQKDPRTLGQGDVFDRYEYMGNKGGKANNKD